jgi:hypothetical protein
MKKTFFNVIPTFSNVIPAKAGIQCFSLFFLLVFPVAVSLATTPSPQRMSPVTSISLTYDLDKSSLHIEAVHPSNNWEIDYVRMMTVSLNGQVVSTLNYYHQTSAAGFSEDVQLPTKVGDVITVDLFCTGGSSMSKDLTVTKPGE